jgi:hypothetical protein
MWRRVLADTGALVNERMAAGLIQKIHIDSRPLA